MRLNLPENANSPDQQAILNALPAIVFLERKGKIVFANLAGRQALGIASGRWTPCPVEQVLRDLSTAAVQPQISLAASGTRFRAKLLMPGGGAEPIEGTYCLLNSQSGEAIIVAHAIGSRESAKSRFVEDVLSSVPEALAIVIEGRVVYVNPSFTRIFGFTFDDVSGRSLRDLIVPETRQLEHSTIEKNVDESGEASLETVRSNRNGELIDVALVAAPLRVAGANCGYIYSFRNIVERKLLEARLQHNVMHDVLTALPNRALFLDRLTVALSRKMRHPDLNCGVLFVDLDNFKSVNDTAGHAAGDELLVTVAARLSKALRPQDTAARLGGDEFAVLVENVTTVADLEAVVMRIMAELERPVQIFGGQIPASASVGVAFAAPDCSSPDALLHDADLAMYRAKQQGGNRYEIFDRSMETHVSIRRERERELRLALENRDFIFVFDPIFHLATGRIESFEMQLRWQQNYNSTDASAQLDSLAEVTGMALQLGYEALNLACRKLRDWSGRSERAGLSINLNLSRSLFYHADAAVELQAMLQTAQIDPARLILEVSESTLNEDPDGAIGILQRFVDLGVRIAVDDFGSGLAPLNHLMCLPIDLVKLDPKVIQSGSLSGKKLVMAEGLIRFGHALGVHMLAQGIETETQLDILRGIGCELGQGTLLRGSVAQEMEVSDNYGKPPSLTRDSGR